jgi:hypothetical protein
LQRLIVPASTLPALARGLEKAERAGVQSTPEPANKANFRQRPLERLLGALLTSQSGISHLYQSGPRMKATKSDWLVYNLNLLQVVLGQMQAELRGRGADDGGPV